jgi:hypothetical protein
MSWDGNRAAVFVKDVDLIKKIQVGNLTLVSTLQIIWKKLAMYLELLTCKESNGGK